MKLDLHVHTRYSGDAITPPWLIMKMLRKRGVDGLAVTDHNTVRGWRSTQEAARRHGLQLILGEEIKVYREGKLSGEVLGLFLNEKVGKGEPGEVIDQVRQQDGIVIIAHPFDSKKGFRNLDSFARRIDAVECLNARLPSGKINELALLFAQRHGTGMTGGSDSHVPWEVGNAWTEAEASDLEDFRKALKKGETIPRGRMEFPVMHFASVVAMVPRKVSHLFE